MPRQRIGDLDFYYELHGQGPRLLFINGSGGDLRQKPRLFDGPLVEHFEVLGYDQRGLGQTSRPAGPYTMAEYGDDAAALLDALGWDRCAVFGVSFGGMVAQEFAVRHPDRITRMVLACTSSGGAGKASYPLHELSSLAPEERGIRGMELADTRYGAEWRAEHPEAAARLLEMMASRAQIGEGDPGREEGMRLQLEARRDHDTYDRIKDLRMPVYLCGGKYDGIACPENMEAIQRQIPGSRLEFFEGGHLFLLQDAKAFPRIVEFLLERDK